MISVHSTIPVHESRHPVLPYSYNQEFIIECIEIDITVHYINRLYEITQWKKSFAVYHPSL